MCARLEFSVPVKMAERINGEAEKTGCTPNGYLRKTIRSRKPLRIVSHEALIGCTRKLLELADLLNRTVSIISAQPHRASEIIKEICEEYSSAAESVQALKANAKEFYPEKDLSDFGMPAGRVP